MFENSDDFDFIPSGGSKLASLFDGSILSNDTNTSLTYTAPKQPKTKKDIDLSESAKSKVQSAVVLAKVVTLWKLEDTDYKCLGKFGLAIIGSADLNLFEIISYKEKNNIILRRKINKSLNFYNQKDYFSSFYDNENQNWLVKFENVDDQNGFGKEIKTYGGNIVISTEPAKSTTGANENVSKPDNPPRESAVSKPEVLPRLPRNVEKETEDANSDSSGSQKRANILSRMAKMGQQILPSNILKNTSTDISDSELDDPKNDCKVPPRRSKRAVPVQVPKEEKLSEPSQQSYLESQVVPTQSNNINYPVQFPQQGMVGAFPQNMVGTFPSNMVSPVMFNPSVPYDGFTQYIASQNTELKLNLAQISAKLDSVLSSGSKSNIKTDDNTLKSKIKTLELRSENLLTELERYEKKYGDLQVKCKKLEQASAESKNTESVIENLNKEIVHLKEDLKIANEKISNYEKLEMDLKKCEVDIQAYEKTIEMQNLKLIDLEKFYEENKDNDNLHSTIDSLNDTVSNLKLKLKDFEERFDKIEAEKQKRNEENEKIVNSFGNKMKDLMNDMYQSILASFEENNSYSVSQIKSQVAQNLKGTTFAIIKEFTDIYKNEEAGISTQ